MITKSITTPIERTIFQLSLHSHPISLPQKPLSHKKPLEIIQNKNPRFKTPAPVLEIVSSLTTGPLTAGPYGHAAKYYQCPSASFACILPNNCAPDLSPSAVFYKRPGEVWRLLHR